MNTAQTIAAPPPVEDEDDDVPILDGLSREPEPAPEREMPDVAVLYERELFSGRLLKVERVRFASSGSVTVRIVERQYGRRQRVRWPIKFLRELVIALLQIGPNGDLMPVFPRRSEPAGSIPPVTESAQQVAKVSAEPLVMSDFSGQNVLTSPSPAEVPVVLHVAREPALPTRPLSRLQQRKQAAEERRRAGVPRGSTMPR
jgi:hypothetical protein